MIFFDNCCPILWVERYLSIGRGLKLRFRPPRSYPILLSCIVFLLLSSSKGYANQITLSLKSVPLETAFEEIKKQSGYGFWYEKKDLEALAKVTVAVTGAGLKQALDLCLKGQPLSYEVFDKTVVVKRKAALPVAVPVKRALQEKVRGKVVDAQTNEPLAGVLVKVSAPAISVVTDDKGVFELNLPNGKYELVVEYMGYRNRVIDFDVPREGELVVGMEDSEQVLDEVKINAGYYSVKDRERTGSIVKVNAKTIEQQNVNNPLLALQGNVAGLQVTQATGVPGGGVSVQVRGRSSLNVQVGNEPLYIVDGVIFPSVRMSSLTANSVTGGGASPLSMISPTEIESIEVLKDADATAIYGARGANGVVLITTKRGKNGLANFSASVNRGFTQVGRKLDLLNTEEYLQMRKEALTNDGLAASALDYDINGIWEKDKYTDWQKYLIGGNAGIINAEVAVSGGNENLSYRISGSFNHEGIVFPGDFGFNRGGINSSMNLGATDDRLKMSLNLGLHRSNSDLPTSDLTNFITLAPNYPDLYDEMGKIRWSYKNMPLTINPIATLQNTINASTDNIIANFSLSYQLVPKLFLKTSVGYTSIKREELTRRPLSGISPATNPTAVNRQSWFGNNFNNNWIAEPQLNFSSTFLKKGKFDALIGMTFQGTDTKFQNINANGFNSDDLMNNIGNAATLTKSENTNSQYRYVAFFSRINYSLSGKYFLNLTGRRDGSSRFGSGRQFANFGAIGAAWIFSDEKWVQTVLPFLSFGKIRGSFGLTGNDQIPDYGYLQLWTNSGAGTYQGISALTINRLSNANYAWEKTKKFEIALQLGALKDRINLEVAYFQNRSSNQLLMNPTPPSVGSVGILENLPATVQNSGVELQFNASPVQKDDLVWKIGFNITIPRNILLAYPNLSQSSNALNYVIGQPVTIRKVYNTSIDPQLGNYVFEDLDASGTRNDADRYISKFIGQKFYGGINHSLSFRQFHLDFVVSFAKQTGNNYMSGVTYSPGYFNGTGGLTNQPRIVLDRWQNEGKQGYVQKFSSTTASFLNYIAARNEGGRSISDASYMRLRSLSFGYRLPESVTGKLRIRYAQVILQGQNIFTLTNYQGLDPENQSIINLPPLRSVTLGIKLTF